MASVDGVKLIRAKMKQQDLKYDFLAGHAGCTRQTIGRLLQRKAVDEDTLIAVCDKLELSVEDIIVQVEPPPAIDLDDAVLTIREKIAPQVKNECGTMRVLDMAQDISLGEIYTDVNILESLTSRREALGLDELYERLCNEQREFERLGWGKTQERVSGLTAVGKNPKLMIWGKPGAGKTTFLKYLSTYTMAGEIIPQSIPVFLSLKALADRGEALLTEVRRKFADYQVSEAEMEALLQQGRCLLLLDGLDEVLNRDSPRIIQEIQAFAAHPNYGKNKILVTCRIAAKEYLFREFQDVEVADFDMKQITFFVEKWFTTHDPNGNKAEKFMEKLKKDQPIQELASSPLLLTLLCLIFGEINDFRRNRAELYEEGVDILLKKWDGTRGIEREQIYRQLSTNRKEDLLSLIALKTFQKDRENIFFKKRTAERLIEGFIANLPDAASDPEALRLDSEQVLKAIEAQHGLLVTRAKGIYSFSHLTFQEYFAARKIALRPSSQGLQDLARRVNDGKWREVIFLTVEQLEDATELFIFLKHAINSLVANDHKIQEYLQWLSDKVDSLTGKYTDNDIKNIQKSFLFDHLTDINSSLVILRYLYIYIDNDDSFSGAFVAVACAGISALVDLFLAISLDLSLDLEISVDIYLYLYIYLYPYVLLKSYDYTNPNLCLYLSNFIAKLPPSLIWLKDILENLLEEFSNLHEKELIKELAGNGKERIHQAMIEHRNIAHNWKFTNEQEELFREYMESNDLLLECLGRECYIDRQIREKIENELFLPQSRLSPEFRSE
ncbi:MAG: NACHT C-terminal helical domain 2-containing protein [Cyanobacteriota bacterium]|jgi:predicted NACHT family NTPase